MSRHADLLGSCVPGNSLLHRMPLWAKAVGLTALCALMLALVEPAVTAGGLLVAVAAYPAAAGLPLRHVVRPLARIWPVLVLLAAYQWWGHGPAFAFSVAGNIAACVLAARLLTLTTEAQVLLDGLVGLARPLRRFGADPERFGLTLALMIRSIPYLAGSVQDVRDTAKARGLERSPRALMVPVVVNAVAYAHRTGDALAARGLAD
jgi:biotin transport system permease protein